jgi:hypothetical protein
MGTGATDRVVAPEVMRPQLINKVAELLVIANIVVRRSWSSPSWPEKTGCTRAMKGRPQVSSIGARTRSIKMTSPQGSEDPY